MRGGRTKVAAGRDFELATRRSVDSHNRFDSGRPRMDAGATAGQDTIKDQAKAELHGGAIIAAIKASGVQFILSVPDIVTSSGLLRPISRDPDLRLVRVCKEDECIGIASGLYFCDKRALILIQYTGFLDSINAITAVSVEY